MDERDQRVRAAAFSFLEAQVRLRGEVLPRTTLAEGFTFEGQRVPLIGPQGIFKPAVLSEMPLTITTVPEVSGRPRPYEDELGAGGLLRYRYRGTDPRHRDNVGLRLAMARQAPLIYLFGVVAGEYMPVWPVFIVGDEPANFTFVVAVDDRQMASVANVVGEGSDARRRYVTAVVLRRVHQLEFRQRVLRAYQERCAICRLRHEELLEAAHILPDGHPKGEPIVPNGLALCKLHHAAFDRMVLGIRPDLVVEVRPDILAEGDGPMLKHGLQGFHEKRILIPRAPANQPNPDFLAERYELFRKAG